VDAAAEGAWIIRTAAGRREVIGTKSTPTDPVTALDLAVEQAIRDRLERLTPGAAFLGEEEGSRAGVSALGWILDPIDGTVNLTYGIPVVAVSLAATISGRVVAGVVIDPWHEEVFSASRGTGARIDGSPVATSNVARLSDALVATGFSYSSEGRATQVEAIARILPAARDVRCLGSSALPCAGSPTGDWTLLPARHAGLGLRRRCAHRGGGRARLEHPTPANGQLMLAASPGVRTAVRLLA